MKGGWFKGYTLAYLVFLYAPIALLPIFAFNDSAIVAFPLAGYTDRWFTQLLTEPQLHEALKNSLIIAVSTAIISTFFGVLAARASTRYRFPGKTPIMGLIMLPLVLPEIIAAVSLLIVFLAIGPYIGLGLSITTIIIGHVLICTPFAVAILTSAFATLDRSLEEAAYDLGESPLSTFFLIILPLVMPGIISSLLITFTVSLDEFIMAFFLGGTTVTLPVYIFSQFRFPQSVPVILALGTILVLLSITLLAIAEYFRRRGIAKSGGKDTGGFL
jgi:spermidine/putrescine transport system permease protein